MSWIIEPNEWSHRTFRSIPTVPHTSGQYMTLSQWSHFENCSRSILREGRITKRHWSWRIFIDLFLIQEIECTSSSTGLRFLAYILLIVWEESMCYIQCECLVTQTVSTGCFYKYHILLVVELHMYMVF